MTTLVLLPGLDGTGEQFAPLTDALDGSVDRRVVSYPTDVVLGYDALLPIARTALPARPFVLVGESFSGPLAIRLAAERPPLLKRLVLVATFHRAPVAPWLAGLASVLAPGLALTSAPPAFAVRQFLAGVDAPPELVTSFRASAAKVSGDVLAARVRAALAVDVSSELERVGVPITYFAATNDALVRREIGAELRALVPSLEVVPFASPHLVLQRRPHETARKLEQLLEA